jgi:heterotetrameric sarcosine oxidase gamma subunit
MDDPRGRPSAVEADGWSVRVQPGLQIASLRYFDRAGSFAAAVGDAVGRPLPQCLRAIQVEEPTNAARFLLAWRSPTETLLLCESSAVFAELERRLANVVDGCMVDQTGGLTVVRVEGPRAGDLLLRLGAATAIPGVGEALTGRMAEVQVLTACTRAGEFLLLVERVYAAHLLGWIGTTAADFR